MQGYHGNGKTSEKRLEIRPSESSFTDDKNTQSNQDKFISSNEQFFKENQNVQRQNQQHIPSLNTGGSLDLSVSKQQSDAEQINRNDQRFMDSGAQGTFVSNAKQSTQKFTFKNGSSEDGFVEGDEVTNQNDSMGKKRSGEKNLKRNVGNKQKLEVETNTNTHKESNNTRENDVTDKNSYRANYNNSSNRNQVSLEAQSSNSTVRQQQHTSKFVSSPPNHENDINDNTQQLNNYNNHQQYNQLPEQRRNDYVKSNNIGFDQQDQYEGSNMEMAGISNKVSKEIHSFRDQSIPYLLQIPALFRKSLQKRKLNLSSLKKRV